VRHWTRETKHQETGAPGCTFTHGLRNAHRCIEFRFVAVKLQADLETAGRGSDEGIRKVPQNVPSADRQVPADTKGIINSTNILSLFPLQ
jgi:hypothetical protein